MAEMVKAKGIAEGAGVALLTIFDENGKVSLGETSALATHLIGAGVRSVLVGGTIGEYYALTDSERIELCGALREVIPAAVPLIFHVGGVPLSRALTLTQAAVNAGADAIIALPRNIEDHKAYYTAIVDGAGSIPVLAYHFPQVGASIDIDSFPELGVAGVKDSSGDASRLELEVETLDIEVYTGATGLLNLAHNIGVTGAFLGIANAQPELGVLAFSGDVDAQQSLIELGAGIAQDFPGGLKRLTGERWNVSTTSRTPPGLAVSQASTSHIDNA